MSKNKGRCCRHVLLNTCSRRKFRCPEPKKAENFSVSGLGFGDGGCLGSAEALVDASAVAGGRFPPFIVRVSAEELVNWRSQIVISNPRAKMSLRRAPYAFTEQGAAMLSSVLQSERAVRVSVEIMRAFNA